MTNRKLFYNEEICYQNYQINEDLSLSIPAQMHNIIKSPIILSNKKQNFVFLYINNIDYFTNLLIKNIEKIEEIEEFIDKADFNTSSYLEYNLIFNLNGMYKKIFVNIVDNKIYEEKQNFKILKNGFEIPFWSINYKNENTKNPIKVISTDLYFTEYFYNYEPCLKRFVLSHQINDDIPFEITRFKFNSNLQIKEASYLIPNLKKERTCFYKPSHIIYYNNNFKDYRYILNDIDYTEKVKSYFKSINVVNINTHIFTDTDISELKKIFKKA